MTKMIKMSLIAATAVAGMSSVATAGSLEDAIKGTDVSGYVDYRYETKSNDKDAKSFNVNEYGVNVTLTSKVNDIVKATVSAGFDEVTTDNATRDDGSTSTATQDTSAPVGVDKAYFTFDLGATTVLAGKQAIPSAFVDKSDTTKTGAGIVALYKASDALTLAGAHFMNNNIGVAKYDGTNTLATTDTKTTELIAMGKVADVSYAFNYNMTHLGNVILGTNPVTNVNADADETRYSLNLKGAVAGIGADFRYSVADSDLTADKGTVTKLVLSGKAAGLSLVAGMAMTGEDNVLKNDVAIDRDNDADVHFKLWQFSTYGLADATAYLLGADMPVNEQTTVGAKYAFGDATGIDSASELLLTATYKMSKNFTVHGRYSMYSVDNGTEKTTDYSRIQVKYTF